jgi:hypothetical protein
MTDDEMREIAFDALREIYQEAEPPLDFDHALENPDSTEKTGTRIIPSRRLTFSRPEGWGFNLETSIILR